MNYFWEGFLIICFMWGMGRCTSAYHPYKRWKKYYLIHHPLLLKICIRNRVGDAPNAMDQNKLRQPAFLIYFVFTPIVVVCYIFSVVKKFHPYMFYFKIGYIIEIIVMVIALGAIGSSILIVIIDAILTQKE